MGRVQKNKIYGTKPIDWDFLFSICKPPTLPPGDPLSTTFSQWKGQPSTRQPPGRRRDAADLQIDPFSRDSADSSAFPLLLSPGFFLPVADSTRRARATLRSCPAW